MIFLSSACLFFFFFFFLKILTLNTIKVLNRLDPDQARFSVNHDLGTIYALM